MNKFDNIEELFKNSLENFEADVDPSVWENVSSQISGQASVPDASSAASSSPGSSALIGSVAVKSIIVIGTAGLLTLGAFYLVKSDTDESTQELTEVSTDIVAVEEQSSVDLIEIEKSDLQELSTEAEVNSISATSEKPIAVEITNEKELNSGTAVIEGNDASESARVSEPTEVKAASTAVAKVATEEKAMVETQDEIEPVKMIQLSASIYASEKSGKKPLLVRFENKGSQTTNIRWKVAGELMYDQEQVINHTFEKSGKFWVVVDIRDESGQRSRDSIEIFVEGNGMIHVPNVFTPNGDGINDAFVLESEDMKSIRCSIVDRSGNLVFKWDNVYGHWDGRDMSGREVESGSYFYVIEAVDNDGVSYLKRGTVSLYRN